MQFKLLVLGVVLLVIGLLVYSTIPNVHQTPVFQTQPLQSQAPLTVPANGAIQIAKNLTLFQQGQNQLQVNITVSTTGAEPSTILLKIFRGNITDSCIVPQKSYIVNQQVSNQTLDAPIGNSGLYCFDFENLQSQSPKTVEMAASINTNFVRVQIANDGGMNLAGLGLGAVGFLIALVGIAKRTVVPWE